MNFGFLLFPELEELDLVGPWEMISMWSQYAGGPERCLMIAETDEPVRCSKGMVVQPHTSFKAAPQLDYLLIPGGMGTRVEVKNKQLIDFVVNQTKQCKAVLSVCTGAFILQASGLLDGKKATTHWLSLDRLRESGRVEVIEERIVRDGNVWTSSGVSAGIDLTLEFIKHTAGEAVAGKVQSFTEYYPSGKNYGTFHLDSKSPAYISRKGRQ